MIMSNISNIESSSRTINSMMILSSSLLMVMLIIALIVRYPHTIEGQIVLISNSRPYEMLTPQSGKLVLLQAQGDTINRDTDIAYIFKSCDYYSAIKLFEVVKTRNLENVYSCLCDTSITNNIGDISAICNELRLLLYQLFNFETINQIRNRVDMMASKDSIYRDQFNIERQILNYESIVERQIDTMCQEDSILFLNGDISKIQLEQSIRNQLEQKHKIQTLKSTMLSLRQDIFQNKFEMNTYVEEMKVKKAMLCQEVMSKIYDLQSTIEIWRSQSVIVAPHDGYFELFPNISDGQMVVSGIQVIRTIPFDDGLLQGEILFDSKESGPLQGNEEVKITMDSYPSSQYGYLKGNVVSYSSSVYSDVKTMSSLRMANVSIDMKNQPYWWTNLNYVHGMTGKAEIIVEDRSLLEQIFNFIIVNIN